MMDPLFNGRVGVIIEVAPNQFVQYVLKEVQADISVERESWPAWDGLLAPSVHGPAMVTMNLRGVLTDPATRTERPVWVPAEPVAELESGRALGQR